MKQEDKFDVFTKKVMKEAGTESPSFDFVSQVMDTILVEEEKEVLTYKPLISKLNWFFITVIASIITIYLVLNSSEGIESKYAFIYEAYLDRINSFYSVFIPDQLSSVTIISFLVFSIFLIIQLIVIKNIFNKRIQKKLAD